MQSKKATQPNPIESWGSPALRRALLEVVSQSPPIRTQREPAHSYFRIVHDRLRDSKAIQFPPLATTKQKRFSKLISRTIRRTYPWFTRTIVAVCLTAFSTSYPY